MMFLAIWLACLGFFVAIVAGVMIVDLRRPESEGSSVACFFVASVSLSLIFWALVAAKAAGVAS